MNILYDLDSFISFFHSIENFYKNKNTEILIIYKLKYLNKKFYIGEEIKIPNKSILSDKEHILIDVKFIYWLFIKQKENGEGLLIIHNHEGNSNPSPKDNESEEKILNIVKKLKVIAFCYAIYSPEGVLLKNYKNGEMILIDYIEKNLYKYQ